MKNAPVSFCGGKNYRNGGLTAMNEGATILTRPDQTRPDQTRPDQTVNYGLALLKIWMSFEVVCAHFWHSPDRNLLILKPFAAVGGWPVMMFMFTAFVLSGKYIIGKNTHKITQRLHRLVIMHVLWTLIYFAVFSCKAIFFGNGIFAGQSAGSIAKSLLAQIFLGSTFNAPMWFQVNLVVLTFSAALIFFKFPEKVAMTIIIFCMAFAVIAQYSGLNFALFGGIKYAHNRYTLGRLCEMIPVAAAGLVFAKFGIMEKLSQHKIPAIIISAAMIVLLRKARLPIPSQGFMYQGIHLILAAILITIFFCMLPMHNLPLSVKNFIAEVSRLTPGVYCMHILAARYIKIIGRYQDSNFSFGGCLVIFAVCLITGFILSRLLGKRRIFLVG